MDVNEISARLYDEITAKELSYGELSRMTGIPKSAIQRYATGETKKIPMDRLELLASALDVSSAYLMGWDDRSQIDPNDPLLELARVKLSISKEEEELVRCWRQATDKEKQNIAFILRDYGMPFPKAEPDHNLSLSSGA